MCKSKIIIFNLLIDTWDYQCQTQPKSKSLHAFIIMYSLAYIGVHNLLWCICDYLIYIFFFFSGKKWIFILNIMDGKVFSLFSEEAFK